MQLTHAAQNVVKIPGSKIAILQSKWYGDITDGMVGKCKEVLALAACDVVDHFVLPGSLEIPLAAQTLARQKKYDALVCFGAIVKGETFHFEMIMDVCTQGLTRIMLDENIPILIEIIPVTSIEHLKARCADDGFNKGIEAGLAAAEIVAWRKTMTT